MNAKKYIDILKDNLCNSALKLGIPISHYFQQDNDPKHIAYIIKLYLLCTGWLQKSRKKAP